MKFLKEDEITLAHINGVRARYKTFIDDKGVEQKTKHYDRLYLGTSRNKYTWLESLEPGAPDDKVYYWFMLGNKNIVFVHDQGAGRLWYNKKVGAQAREYLAAYKRIYNIPNEACIGVDFLPTHEPSRGAGGAVDSVQALARAALTRAGNIEIDF